MTNWKIEQLQLGPMDNFIYVVADVEANVAVVVDPAWDATEIVDAIDEKGYELTAIWLTHGHDDHTNIVPALVAQKPAPVYLSKRMPLAWRPDVAPTYEFDDGDELTVGDIRFTVMATPGHSPDGTCFLHGKHLIAGDTLFIDGCGRCDLKDSDVYAMFESIRRLMALPSDTIVYPGHDYGATPTDSIENQKQTNRFMVAKTLDAFVRERMG